MARIRGNGGRKGAKPPKKEKVAKGAKENVSGERTTSPGSTSLGGGADRFTRGGGGNGRLGSRYQRGGVGSAFADADRGVGRKKDVTDGAKKRTAQKKNAGGGTSTGSPGGEWTGRKWKELGISGEDAAKLRDLVAAGKKEEYVRAATKKHGMTAEEADHFYSAQEAYNQRNAERKQRKNEVKEEPAEEKPAEEESAGETPAEGGTEGGTRSRVVSGAKKKGRGATGVDWAEFNRRPDAKSYYEMMRVAVQDGKEGAAFRGTENGKKNKWGFTHDEMKANLAFLKRNPGVIDRQLGESSGGGAGRKSKRSGTDEGAETSSGTSRFDPDAPITSSIKRPTGKAATYELAKAHFDPSRHNLLRKAAVYMTPGGWAQGVTAALKGKMSAVERQRIMGAVNTTLATLAVGDMATRAVQSLTGGDDLEHQNWSAVEYLNPLLGAAKWMEGKAREWGKEKPPDPQALMTDHAKALLAEEKRFLAGIDRVRRGIGDKGEPLSFETDFTPTFNLVRARYADDMSRASKITDEMLRAQLVKKATDTATARLDALGSSPQGKQWLASMYAPSDLEAVNTAFKKQGGSPVDALPASAEDLDAVFSDESEAIRGMYKKAYTDAMKEREALPALKRLGW